MDTDNKIYSWGFSASLILILMLIVVSILAPELLKEGMASKALLSTIKTSLLIGVALCGLVMWCYAIQRLVYVWKWSPTNKKISGVIFVMVFPGLSGLYLYYLDKQEADRMARKIDLE